MKKYKLGMEIGCGDAYSSELLNRFEEFDSIYLIEPNEILYHDISSASNPHENIIVGNFAIGKKISDIYSVNSSQFFYNFGYCSYLHNADSFLKLSCEEDAIEYWKPLKSIVRCNTMSFIDKGDIDYLILTCNGSELFVLEDMISRPEIIRTKYYCHNAKHWEYYNKISQWMMFNKYEGALLERNHHGTYFHIEFRKK